MCCIVISVALHVEFGGLLCRFDVFRLPPPPSPINLLLSLHVHCPAAACCTEPHPALSPHIFALSGGAMLLPRRTVRGPHTAPALMRCSCFQIQPLILILFLLLNMAPKGTSDPVVFLCFLSDSWVHPNRS